MGPPGGWRSLHTDTTRNEGVPDPCGLTTIVDNTWVICQTVITDNRYRYFRCWGGHLPGRAIIRFSELSHLSGRASQVPVDAPVVPGSTTGERRGSPRRGMGHEERVGPGTRCRPAHRRRAERSRPASWPSSPEAAPSRKLTVSFGVPGRPGLADQPRSCRIA
jgi:hypothetical protein